MVRRTCSSISRTRSGFLSRSRMFSRSRTARQFTNSLRPLLCRLVAPGRPARPRSVRERSGDRRGFPGRECTAATITLAASDSGWPAGASRAAWCMAKPTSSPTTSSETRFTSESSSYAPARVRHRPRAVHRKPPGPSGQADRRRARSRRQRDPGVAFRQGAELSSRGRSVLDLLRDGEVVAW